MLVFTQVHLNQPDPIIRRLTGDLILVSTRNVQTVGYQTRWRMLQNPVRNTPGPSTGLLQSLKGRQEFPPRSRYLKLSAELPG